MSAPFSPIIMVGAFVFPLTIYGILQRKHFIKCDPILPICFTHMLASITRKFCIPWTLSRGSTTAIGSDTGPILHVPDG